ncbi:MAG: mevalonate kinase [Deltaproteobacteria bacterium]|nr:mevalonate kinase [Deltaproteobacteria bacterium]
MTAAGASPTGHANGKLILLGEHAVVWGAPALAVAIEREVRAVGRRGTEGGPWLEMLGSRHRADGRSADGIARAFAALLEAAGAGGDLSIQVAGELPAGVGLGFSAAAGVAIARALEGVGPALAAEQVRTSAMAWERVFHGNPSGVDVAAAMGSGLIRFTRADGPAALATEAPLALCVGLTGVRSATKDMVGRVASLRDREPERVGRCVEQIGRLVEQAVDALSGADWPTLGSLMDQNQALLERLDVSTSTLATLCTCARDAGALGAKLTGAGGGGAVVALGGTGRSGRQVGAQVIAAWRKRGWDGFVTEVARPGGHGSGGQR